MKKKCLFAVWLSVLLSAVCFCASASAQPADTTPEITFNTVSVIDVKLGTAPDKTTYAPGDQPDYTGATLVVYYNDGTSSTEGVMSSWCTGFDSSASGVCTVTVRYPDGGPPVTFSVTVSEPAISKIAITKAPDKTVYLQGEAIDTKGLAVSATYANGVTLDITRDCTVQAVDTSGPEQSKEVYIFYYSGGKRYQTSYTVEIRPVTPVSASITGYPQKLTYGDGEEPDFTGLSVNVIFTDGEKQISKVYSYPSQDFTVSGFDSGSLGTKEIKVLCRGFEMSFNVTIIKSSHHVHVPGEYKVTVPADCLHTGREEAYCTVCGEKADERDTPLAEHTFDEWYIVKPATVYAPGVMTRRCTVCGATEEASIPQIETEPVTTEEPVPTEPQITTDEPQIPDTGTEEPGKTTGPEDVTVDTMPLTGPQTTGGNSGGRTSGDILKIVLIVLAVLVVIAFAGALIYNRFIY